jgi:phosphoglycerate dehydrogenase-like enzyme
MSTAPGRLRVAVAAALAPDLAERMVQLEPRIDLVVDQTLLPPMRFPADYSGDPAFSRTPAEQAGYEELLDSADALYGIPDVDPAALARTVAANPKLRWVHTMAAGGGGQVRAAGLSAADLERVRFTTSAGVHGEPLAEFALFGVIAGAKHLPRLLAQQRAREWSGR